MYASTLPRSNWLRRASIPLAWYRHMPASSCLGLHTISSQDSIFTVLVLVLSVIVLVFTLSCLKTVFSLSWSWALLSWSSHYLVSRQYFHCIGLGLEHYCLGLDLSLDDHCLSLSLGTYCLGLITENMLKCKHTFKWEWTRKLIQLSTRHICNIKRMCCNRISEC